MTLYEESASWCEEYAKTNRLRYRAKYEEGEKYFASKEEAQIFFEKYMPKPYTNVTLICSNSGEFTDIEVKYS